MDRGPDPYQFPIRKPMAQAPRPTILILTTHTGGGHLNLAQALKDILGTCYEVAIVDPQPAIVDSWYSWISQHFLKFFDWQFNWTDNEIASLGLHSILTLFSLERLLTIIQQVHPRLILTTHALLAYSTSLSNERLRKPVP